MITVASLWRHPIKSHGREQINAVTLTAGQAMPWDRHWAMVHDEGKVTPGVAATEWAPCQNFMIGTRTPGLAGLWATLDEETAQVTLRHRDLGTIIISPDAESDRLIEWLSPICPTDRARPAGIVRIGPRGWTDTDYPSVSIMTTASHTAVAKKLGTPLELERWRGNIWLDGTADWEEMTWIDKQVKIGGAVLAIREPIKRCLHTTANPNSGVRDADTLGALDAGWGHKNFGVYAEVIQSGPIRAGDTLELV
jgi:uncharacterized protein YcbX